MPSTAELTRSSHEAFTGAPVDVTVVGIGFLPVVRERGAGVCVCRVGAEGARPGGQLRRTPAPRRAFLGTAPPGYVR